MAAFGSGRSVPLGWNYDALNNQYIGPNGDIITMTEINHFGTITDVLLHRQYEETKKQMMMNTSITGTGSVPGSMQQAVSSMGSLTISPVQPVSTLSFDTDHGRVSLNIKTGDLTIPGGMSRQDAIREFWFGFQEHFNPHPEATKYINQISWWKKKAEDLEQHADEYAKYALKEANKKIAEKIANKYAGEKFIMVKPDDLIKFIEEG